jgi:hypothetical protein
MDWRRWLPAAAGLAEKAEAAGLTDAAELIWQASDEVLGFPASWMTTATEVEAVRLRMNELLKS